MSESKKEESKNDAQEIPEELLQKELSEEDQILKDKLDAKVGVLTTGSLEEKNKALENLKGALTDTTKTAVGQIPKPLRFIKDHYKDLCELYAKKEEKINQKLFADILSMVAITVQEDGARECLTYKLQGTDELESYGYEYIKNLSGEIGEEYQHRINENENITEAEQIDLLILVNKIVPYLKKNNHEADACDLLMEVERLEQIVDFVDKDNYQRICMYLTQASKYHVEPENMDILAIVYKIYTKIKDLPAALRIAMLMNNMEYIVATFKSSTDKLMTKQLALDLARQNIMLDEDDIMEDEDSDEDSDESDEDEYTTEELMGNSILSNCFLHYAKELDSLEPKTPEDIYKASVEDNSRGRNLDSARQNLASTFVNAFVNAGYGTDKLMTDKDSKWLYKNKDSGKMSAAASLGMLYMWNTEDGLNEIDSYNYGGDKYVRGGVLLGVGLINSGIRSDVAYALLSESLENKSKESRIGAILGLGLGYAGSAKEDCLEELVPIIADNDQPFDLVCFSALALGQIFVGTCNDEISGNIIQVFLDRPDDLDSPLTKYLCLALGLLYLGKQQAASVIIDTVKNLSEKVAEYCVQTVETCAYAGTGNVLQIQKLLAKCGEHPEKPDKKNLKKGEEPPKPKVSPEQGVATIGLSLIAMGEESGTEMLLRLFDHLLRYGEQTVKKAVPLAIGLSYVSNPVVRVMDTLGKLSHDSDDEVAQNAILALGLVAAGTNNARVAKMLRQLANYYAKKSSILFVVKIAQGIVYSGKGLVTLSPLYNDRMMLKPTAVSALLIVLHSCLDMEKTILGDYHYMLYHLATAMRPRFAMCVDEKLEPVPVQLRVGQAVDIVGLTGKPRKVTGFQTIQSPVSLAFDERAVMADPKYDCVKNDVLEGIIIVKKHEELEQLD